MVSHYRKTLELCFLTGNYLGMPSLPKGVVCLLDTRLKARKIGKFNVPKH